MIIFGDFDWRYTKSLTAHFSKSSALLKDLADAIHSEWLFDGNISVSRYYL